MLSYHNNHAYCFNTIFTALLYSSTVIFFLSRSSLNINNKSSFIAMYLRNHILFYCM